MHTRVTIVIFEGISCSDVQFCLKLTSEFCDRINTRKNLIRCFENGARYTKIQPFVVKLSLIASPY